MKAAFADTAAFALHCGYLEQQSASYHNQIWPQYWCQTQGPVSRQFIVKKGHLKYEIGKKRGQNCQKTFTNFLGWPLCNHFMPFFYESYDRFFNGIFPVDHHEKLTTFIGVRNHKKVAKTTYPNSKHVYKHISSTWTLHQKNVYNNVKIRFKIPPTACRDTQTYPCKNPIHRKLYTGLKIMQIMKKLKIKVFIWKLEKKISFAEKTKSASWAKILYFREHQFLRRGS